MEGGLDDSREASPHEDLKRDGRWEVEFKVDWDWGKNQYICRHMYMYVFRQIICTYVPPQSFSSI